jgi:hypothetical protein
MSREYRALFDKVLDYARELVAKGDGKRARVHWWSALAALRSVGSSPAAAIATLRSRAPQADGDQLELAATLAPGAPGQAAALAASGMTGAYQQILGVLATLPQLNHAMIHGLSEQFMKQFPDRGISGFSYLLSLAIQRHLRTQMGTASPLPAERQAFDRMGHALTAIRWSEICAGLQASEQRASALNQDKKQFVLNAFYSLDSAVRP